MREIAQWVLDSWGLARVAALPADMLELFRAPASRAAARQLAAIDAELRTRREDLLAPLHDAIGGCADRSMRRWLLATKRDVFGGRPLATADPPASAGGERPIVIRELGALLGREAQRRDAVGAYEAALASEMEAAAETADRLAADPVIGCAMVLANAEAAMGSDGTRSRRRRRRVETVVRQVTRSATRTTPFGASAAATLIRLVPVPRTSPVEHRRRTRAQVNLTNLDRWMDASLSESARERLPLRLAPLRSLRDDGATLLAATLNAELPRGSGGWNIAGFVTASLDDALLALLDEADGRSMASLLQELHTADQRAARHATLVELLSSGLLERFPPRSACDAPGLERLSARAAACGDARTARQLFELAGLLRAADDQEGLRTLVEHLSREHRPYGATPLLYVDSTVDGLSAAQTGFDSATAVTVLEPVLRLAGSACDVEHHRMMAEAFAARFGWDGECNDVGALLIDLLSSPEFMVDFRSCNPVPAWTSSPLGDYIRNASGSRCQVPAQLFSSLPQRDEELAIAVFIQVATDDEYRLVLNGVQSGRSKYLSRYLDFQDRSALGEIRECFDHADPVGVEIAPLLGLNLQVHPPMTRHALQVPFEPESDHTSILPLSDLRLRFDGATYRPILTSSTLGVAIEPVHLGFLRDIALPDELLLLRALSPRFGEELLAERVDLYNYLDWGDLLQGRELAPHRPRLEVGQLVLERERWAVSSAELPKPESHETAARYLRRMQAWREGTGWPEQVFARMLRSRELRRTAGSPRQYLDWSNPFTFWWLMRSLAGDDPGWLVATEILPDPESSVLRLDGRAHAAELMVQLRRSADGA